MAATPHSTEDVPDEKTGFFDLARELRDKIYENATGTRRMPEIDVTISPQTCADLHDVPSLALKLTCRQAKGEYEESLARLSTMPRLVITFSDASCPRMGDHYLGHSRLTSRPQLPRLPPKLPERLAGVEQMDIVFERGGDLEPLVNMMPQLKLMRRIHHRDHTKKLRVIDGVPTLRLYANDQALRAATKKQFDRYGHPYADATYTTENVLIVHGKLFCMWEHAVDQTFAERYEYDDHPKNTMTYSVKDIGASFTVQNDNLYGSQDVRYVDVELEPASFFAGSFEEVKADLEDKWEVTDTGPMQG